MTLYLDLAFEFDYFLVDAEVAQLVEQLIRNQ